MWVRELGAGSGEPEDGWIHPLAIQPSGPLFFVQRAACSGGDGVCFVPSFPRSIVQSLVRAACSGTRCTIPNSRFPIPEGL